MFMRGQRMNGIGLGSMEQYDSSFDVAGKIEL